MMRPHHIAILSSDKEASLAFYRTLGFSLTETVNRPACGDEICFLSGNGMTLELFIAAGRPPHVSDPEAYGVRHLAFACTDLDALRASLLVAGYLPEPLRRDSRTGERMFFVKDPDGLPMELREQI
ncbi:MAG: VOC family protein [Clostridia bacterium]|nr:VOC family protein [Clostridia bacterium]